MFRLIKASSPGWEKDFPTKVEACSELLRHICGECLAGEHRYVGVATEYGDIPDRKDIHALLGTTCGCEFWLEEETADQVPS